MCIRDRHGDGAGARETDDGEIDMAVGGHVRGRKSSGEGLMVCVCMIEGEKIFLEGSEKSVGCSGDKRW